MGQRELQLGHLAGKHIAAAQRVQRAGQLVGERSLQGRVVAALARGRIGAQRHALELVDLLQPHHIRVALPDVRGQRQHAFRCASGRDAHQRGHERAVELLCGEVWRRRRVEHRRQVDAEVLVLRHRVDIGSNSQ
jgi:hypothetical protein